MLDVSETSSVRNGVAACGERARARCFCGYIVSATQDPLSHSVAIGGAGRVCVCVFSSPTREFRGGVGSVADRRRNGSMDLDAIGITSAIGIERLAVLGQG